MLGVSGPVTSSRNSNIETSSPPTIGTAKLNEPRCSTANPNDRQYATSFTRFLPSKWSRTARRSATADATVGHSGTSLGSTSRSGIRTLENEGMSRAYCRVIFTSSLAASAAASASSGVGSETHHSRSP